MNKKIQKYLDEIEKSEKKIAELQQYIKETRIALKKEEDMEMVRSIRGMNLDRDELFRLLEGLQSGSVSFRKDPEGKSDRAKDSTLERKEDNDGEMDKME